MSSVSIVHFLAKLVLQLGHFATKSFAHFLYSTIMGVAKWKRDLSLFCESVKWEQFWPWLILSKKSFTHQSEQLLIGWRMTYVGIPEKGKFIGLFSIHTYILQHRAKVVGSYECISAHSLCILFIWRTRDANYKWIPDLSHRYQQKYTFPQYSNHIMTTWYLYINFQSTELMFSPYSLSNFTLKFPAHA